eukprot:6201846-Pleurochrysis_carterae.AAC.1
MSLVYRYDSYVLKRVGRPVRLALYGRFDRKSVGLPEAVPSRSAPPRSGVVVYIQHRETSKQSRGTNASNGRPVGLVLYGRLNRKLVGSPEAVPLRSAPPTSGVVNT